MIIYADIGGTKTRIWSEGRGKATELIIGSRGVWTGAEKNRWKKKLHLVAAQLGDPRITILSDIELAHHLAFGKEPGIVLNAGTGSIAFGRNKKGKTARAGGLGPLIGDEGSGFWIGKEYLKLLLSRGKDEKKVRPYVAGENPVKKIAALTKNVLTAAKRKPSSAEAKIIDSAQAHLKKLVNDIRRKLNIGNDIPVYLTGGLFDDRFFRSRWQTSLSRR